MKTLIHWFLVILTAVWILFLMAGCASPRPWTEGEKIVAAWSILAVSADMYTTCQALDNPNNYETNPMIGKHPSDEKVVIYLSLTHLIFLGVSHWVPEITLPLLGKFNLRYGLLGPKAAINTHFAVGNTQLDW